MRGIRLRDDHDQLIPREHDRLLDEAFVVELLRQRGVRRGEDVGGRALPDLRRERVRAAERVLLGVESICGMTFVSDAAANT